MLLYNLVIIASADGLRPYGARDISRDTIDYNHDSFELTS